MESSDELGPAGHRKRLREKFERNGLGAFNDYEVVELLLTLAIPRGDVKPAAKALIATFGNLQGILDASADELRAVKGIGEVTPVARRLRQNVCNASGSPRNSRFSAHCCRYSVAHSRTMRTIIRMGELTLQIRTRP